VVFLLRRRVAGIGEPRSNQMTGTSAGAARLASINHDSVNAKRETFRGPNVNPKSEKGGGGQRQQTGI
jgi:hypothetical protein